MSLLLLFPNNIVATTGWTIVTCSGATWTNASCAAKDLWGDWSPFTWAQIQATGFTWDQMAGHTFVTTSSPTTVWAATTC